jgi:hypothetical protein
MKSKLKVGIVGGAGYTGGETIRLLLNHPYATLTFVHSRSNAGNPLHSAHPDLIGETDLKFSDQLQNDVDVIFLCLGHGESKKFLQENAFPASVKIIDLSQDFRLGESLPGREFVYGLPELNKNLIQKPATSLTRDALPQQLSLVSCLWHKREYLMKFLRPESRVQPVLVRNYRIPHTSRGGRTTFQHTRHSHTSICVRSIAPSNSFNPVLARR